MCVCSLRYPVCNAHAPYCHCLQYFSTLSHKRHDLRKQGIEHKMWVLIFYATFVWNISHSKKNWARYDKNCILVFVWCTGYCCHILMKLEFSWQIFEKHSNIKFHENPPSESRVVPCGRTDRHDKANNHFSHFRESAWNSTFCPHSAFMCFVWIWEQTAIIFLYSIKLLVFITEI